MGKEKAKATTRSQRHDPLETQMKAELFVEGRRAPRLKKSGSSDREKNEYLDEKTSRKVLRLAREQMQAENAGRGRESDDNDDDDNDGDDDDMRVDNDEDQDRREVENGDDDDDDDDGTSSVDSMQATEEQMKEYQVQMDDELVSLDPEEERTLALFSNPFQSRNLADIIMAKIREKELQLGGGNPDAASVTGTERVTRKLPKKVVQVYQSIGKLLSRYKSGRLPKAFKIVPSLSNWEEILYLMRPDEWTPNAVYQATRLFTANLNARMAQRFFNMVLLPRVRDDITQNKRLNFHLYQALRRACFKPAAFYKGIVLPLCLEGNCTHREALIISSVVAKQSLPYLHSSAALLKIVLMPYSGSNSIFIKVLLNKKYALPYKVIDAVVDHFMRFADPSDDSAAMIDFETDENISKQVSQEKSGASKKLRLPVLWHQALLVFVQRYKTDLTRQQKKMIFFLCRQQFHSQITPEVRREMENSACRGEVINPDTLQGMMPPPGRDINLMMDE